MLRTIFVDTFFSQNNTPNTIFSKKIGHILTIRLQIHICSLLKSFLIRKNNHGEVKTSNCDVNLKNEKESGNK